MAKSKTKVVEKVESKLKTLASIIGSATIVCGAIIGSVTWVLQQTHNEVSEKLDEISSQISTVELNSTRTQLLTLISSFPDNEDEILKVAKYYFRDLGGDWYMTALFTEWAEERDISIDTIINIGGK